MKVEEHPLLVVVVWDDAWCAGIELLSVKDVQDKHHPSVMQSLGWLLQDDPAGVWIANERCLDKGDDTYRGHTFIPRSLIKSVTPFKLQSAKRGPRAKIVHNPDHGGPGGNRDQIPGQASVEGD